MPAWGGAIRRLQSAAAELRTKLERDHLAARARIAELERELAVASIPRDDPPLVGEAGGPDPTEPAHREEMAGALAAAVERLRARAVPAPEAARRRGRSEGAAPEAPGSDRRPAPRLEPPTVIVVPRLFPSPRRHVPRVALAVRRVAVRLTEWADRAQGAP